MIIKKEKDDFFAPIKKILTKRLFITLFVLILIPVFFIGVGVGLFVTNFFGTIDHPSEQVITMLDELGIKHQVGSALPFITDVKGLIIGLKEENIMIVPHAIRGLFSKPERLDIDISFENLQRLELKRQQSIALGFQLTEDADFVKAVITSDGVKYPVDMRLKGDDIDPLLSDKWSFRFKLRDDNVFRGMRVFSIQSPKTRIFMNEILFHWALKDEGLISLRTGFFDVYINGDRKGIYELEEHFDKMLIENNSLREAPILKFNEELVWLENIKGPTIHSNLKETHDYLQASVDVFQENKVKNDPVLHEEYAVAVTMLNAFKEGRLTTSQVFDVEKLARFLAVSHVFGAGHGMNFNNIRFYFNPFTSKLEPIGYDAGAGPVDESFATGSISLFEKQIYADHVFYAQFVQELQRVSDDSYLDEFFARHDDAIEEYLSFIYKDYPFYHFPRDVFYQNQDFIVRFLNPPMTLQSYARQSENGDVVVEIANLQQIPVVVVGLVVNGTVLRPEQEVVIPSRQPGNALSFTDMVYPSVVLSDAAVLYSFVGLSEVRNDSAIVGEFIDEDVLTQMFLYDDAKIDNPMILSNTDTLVLQSGRWVLDENLVIPAGYRVLCEQGLEIVLNNASLISYSPFDCHGTPDAPVSFVSSGGGGVVFLQTNSASYFTHVSFVNLSAPDGPGWHLTGSVTFYESPLVLRNVHYSSSHSEDSINIIRSEFKIYNSLFERSFSDALDVDFGTGQIVDSVFMDCTNDCIDVSGTIMTMSGVTIVGSGDKGVSVGEDSTVQLSDVSISRANIGIASKDRSKVYADGVDVTSSGYAFAAYRKKTEFGPASIVAENVKLTANVDDYIIEEGSELFLNGEMVKEKSKDVYQFLFGDE